MIGKTAPFLNCLILQKIKIIMSESKKRKLDKALRYYNLNLVQMNKVLKLLFYP